jgi:NTP pyrophosphatase (non-canonical NTP hydrolase)
MSFNELSSRMKKQLEARGYLPTEESECVYRLMEEVGEVAEALREGHTKSEVGSEILDVCWQAMRLALFLGIDLDEAFEDKLAFNETRGVL